MNLRQATVYIIVGTSYLFLVRMVATIAPEINSSLTFFRINSLLSLLAALTPIVFFATFRQRFILEEQILLAKTTTWALIGSVAVACLFLKGPVIAFRLPLFPNLFQSDFFETVGPALTWVSSALILVFFLILFRELRSSQPARLPRATACAAAGSAISFLMRTALLVSYLVTGDLRWVSDLPRGVQWGLLPLELLAFLALIYFFAALHRSRRVLHVLDIA